MSLKVLLLISSPFFPLLSPTLFFGIVIVLVLSLLNFNGKNLIIPTSHYSFHRNFSVDLTLCFAVLGRQYKQCFYGICLVCNFWQGPGLILTQEHIPLTSIYCCCVVVPFISTKNSDFLHNRRIAGHRLSLVHMDAS